MDRPVEGGISDTSSFSGTISLLARASFLSCAATFFFSERLEGGGGFEVGVIGTVEDGIALGP